MTNQQAEPFAPAPPPGYWTEHQTTAASRARARNRGENRAVDEFVDTVNRTADLIARPNPDPRIRAEGYRNKPPELWAEQFINFRDDFEEDWADWERIDPGHALLQEETLRQVEVLLSQAGVLFDDRDVAGL